MPRTIVGGVPEDASHKNIYHRPDRVSPAWTSAISDHSEIGSQPSGSENIRRNIIVAELDDIPHGATLEELVTIIGPLTSDRGAVMRAIAAEELDEFVDLAGAAWRARGHGSETVLADQQETLHRHYNQWRARMEAVAEKCRQMLLQVLPEFDVQRYKQDPEYLKQLVLAKNGEQFSGRVKEWKQNHRDHLANLRAKIERLESEDEELRKQLEQVRDKQKSRHKSHVARQHEIIDQNRNIEQKCKEIKSRIGENAKKIDALLLQLEKDEKTSVPVSRRLDFDDEEYGEGTEDVYSK